MVAATIHADAPAAADETPAPARMTLHVKVTFAWSNHSSTDHLTHNRDVEILDDGSETLAEVKARFAEAEGIPVEMVRFLWFDETIGRRYMNRPEEEQESRTLADLNVIYWLKRFPHWKMVATIVEDEPVEELEKVHRTVAVVHKGMKDGSAKLDRYINVKKKQPSWNTLVYGAPRPYDKRYPETMPQK